MKFYRVETEGDNYGPNVVERHDQEFGEWCRREDVLVLEARVAELEGIIVAARRDIDMWEWLPVTDGIERLIQADDEIAEKEGAT